MPNWLIRTQDAFMKLHPAFIKGFISVCIGFLVFQQMFFNSDEAYKYVNPYVLYWLNWIVGSLAIIANSMRDAVSAYYTDKDNAKKAETLANVNTEILKKSDLQK